MNATELGSFGPVFLLALLRVGGVVAFAPVFSSSAIPVRLKAAIAVMLTVGLAPMLPHSVELPSAWGGLTLLAIRETAIGALLGLGAGLAFVGLRWAGEMIGLQMGLSLAAAVDPQSGEEVSLIGNLYLLFGVVVFLLANGHHAVIRAMASLFQLVPVATASVDRRGFDTLVGLVQAATVLAIQLAAPMVLTMIIVDIALGLAVRMLPQLNAMSLGLMVRAAVGLVVLFLGAVMTARVLGSMLARWMNGLPMPLAAGGGHV